MMKFPNKRIAALLLAALSLTGAGVSAGVSAHLCRSLYSQQAAERWAGEGELNYAQISAFCSQQANVLETTAEGIREGIDSALTNASLQASEGGQLWYSCYSAPYGTAVVRGAKKNSTTAQITAVGGDFFTMHPMTLLSGCYISPGDLMHDRAVIDEDLAWKTFGSSDVAGMEIQINDKVYQIAGVVAPERDQASRTAYGEQPRLYLPYEALSDASDAHSADEFGSYETPETGTAAAVTCYEAVLPDPVRGFALNTIQNALGERDGMVLLQNTGRTSLKHRWDNLRHLREMVLSEGIAYPYWENAARMVDFTAAQLLGLTILLLVYPVLLGIWYLWKGYRALERFIDQKREAHKRRYRTIEKDPYSL